MFKKNTFEDLIETIHQGLKNSSHLIIAVSGFGGSGKSTLSRKLADTLQNSIVIAADEFITDRLSERSADWNGFDWDRLILQALKPIQQGAKSITYGVYDWPQNRIVYDKPIEVPKYTIVEGVGLIRESLKSYFDLTVWIDMPLQIASERGKTRDREEYKVKHDELWDRVWTSNDHDYYQKYHPKTHADFVLSS